MKNLWKDIDEYSYTISDVVNIECDVETNIKQLVDMKLWYVLLTSLDTELHKKIYRASDKTI